MLYPRSYHEAYAVRRVAHRPATPRRRVHRALRPPYRVSYESLPSQQAASMRGQGAVQRRAGLWGLRQGQAMLWAVVVFFGLWMGAGALLLLSYMSKYLF